MLLKDKKAIVTGASRGIGKAIAETFASSGASLVICGKSDAIHKVASELSGKEIKVKAVQGNIKEDSHVKEIVKAAKEHLGTVDILVNNAGILQQGLLGMISLDSMREVMDVNIISMINLTQYALRLMAKSGSIINISSILGTKGSDGVSVYSASKSAIIGFTLSASKELAKKGIRVNAIAPGFIETDMTKDVPKEKFINNIKLGRVGMPQDVANCTLFLASDLSSYVTGQIIGVDGGMIV